MRTFVPTFVNPCTYFVTDFLTLYFLGVCVQLEIFQFKRFYENVRGKLSQIVKKDYNNTIRQLDTLPFRSRCALAFDAITISVKAPATVTMEIAIPCTHSRARAHFRFKGSLDEIKSLSGNLKRTNSSHR